MRLFNEIRLDNLRGDLFGGVTAAVIALPMALAFGVATGAGPAAGLYGAVLVGLFAALFGATPTLISEPTGPMTVVMTAVIASLIALDPEQGMAMAFTVVMLAGVFQILFGLLRLGKYVTLMPYTVVSGFMTGIGLILIVLQIGPFLGQAAPGGGVLGTLGELPALIAGIEPAETLLALATLALILFFPRRWRRVLPPQLLALVLGTLVSLWLLGDGEIRRIGEIPSGLPELQLPVFSAEQWRRMLTDALVLAALGSIDALLTSVIAESMTRKPCSADKELVGQGLGNLASGLCGGIPGAGATMGTVVNIQTGARSALSGIARALILLVVVLWAGGLTAQIPLAVLAGIAMKVGLDIVDWSFLRRAHRVSFKAAAIMYAVIGLTVFVDLVTAVALGMFVANLLTIDRLSRLQSREVRAIQHPDDPAATIRLSDDEQALLERGGGRVLLFTLGGPLIFGLAKAISRQHAVLEDHDVLILDVTEVPLLGVSSSLALERLVLEDLEQGRTVILAGARGEVSARLEQLGLLARLPAKHLVADRAGALALAERLLESRAAA
ncbi:SulP family inorganic anion transporter [Marichromatium gracile]|uniref:SulP family sulfate permease n=1 Tax=Marichromatium gracile TaxID=1048 RepID=A0A4R4ALT3_MARGR|nr:SulP family inorganic anion transporter [Marichromatium gracile]MBK1710313.1 sodium-independent anion transporter [Marichromatium gracile]MBO8087029.1 SulP family inorganic anion transporter [Marichromatium sp.]TCW40124.1 SulP family sulfate permease [Marichromatium gracile]